MPAHYLPPPPKVISPKIKALLLRCNICLVRWDKELEETTDPETGKCVGADPASVVAFSDFAGQVWKALDREEKEFLDIIETEEWGLHETLDFLEKAVNGSENR